MDGYNAAADVVEEQEELYRSRECFERLNKGLDLFHFSVQVLSTRNGAVAPLGPDPVEMSYTSEPLAHYWTAASHNSCISAGI
eukprot:5100297-Prymnesium_polylepis.1